MGSTGTQFDLATFGRDLRDLLDQYGLTVEPCVLESVAGAKASEYYGIAFRQQHDIQRDNWRMQILMRVRPVNLSIQETPTNG